MLSVVNEAVVNPLFFKVKSRFFTSKDLFILTLFL
jgi:hypothetical protein